jgi:hypothetical protein
MPEFLGPARGQRLQVISPRAISMSFVEDRYGVVTSPFQPMHPRAFSIIHRTHRFHLTVPVPPTTKATELQRSAAKTQRTEP